MQHGWSSLFLRDAKPGCYVEGQVRRSFPVWTTNEKGCWKVAQSTRIDPFATFRVSHTMMLAAGETALQRPASP
jgi:hypothetical protein